MIINYRMEINVQFVKMATSDHMEAFVIKKWCAICLAVGAASLGLAAIGTLNIPFTIQTPPTINFIIIFSIVALLYFFLKEKTNTKPILLLDDIFDKLDENRVSNLLELAMSEDIGQIFITHTENKRLEDVLNQKNYPFQMFKL